MLNLKKTWNAPCNLVGTVWRIATRHVNSGRMLYFLNEWNYEYMNLLVRLIAVRLGRSLGPPKYQSEYSEWNGEQIIERNGERNGDSIVDCFGWIAALEALTCNCSNCAEGHMLFFLPNLRHPSQRHARHTTFCSEYRTPCQRCGLALRVFLLANMSRQLSGLALSLMAYCGSKELCIIGFPVPTPYNAVFESDASSQGTLFVL